jgi:hypothetical protein
MATVSAKERGPVSETTLSRTVLSLLKDRRWMPSSPMVWTDRPARRLWLAWSVITPFWAVSSMTSNCPQRPGRATLVAAASA